jgi:hypothetical protein
MIAADRRWLDSAHLPAQSSGWFFGFHGLPGRVKGDNMDEVIA